MVVAAPPVLTARADQPNPQPPLRLELDLFDGSHLIGTPSLASVPVQTPYAKIDIPLPQVVTVKFDDNHEYAAIDLRNGDKLKGVVHLDPVALESVFGKLSVAVEHIRKITVTASGGPMPAGEGPLSFGGLNWQPWRTEFEVQADKLLSLPRARPGFIYGHGGNGRGATVMCNVGSTDWKDYRLECELGMNGVDPAFNPHGLTPDFRSASVMFHVADAKESWNVRGTSWYAFGIGGDGSWSLACCYNNHCQTPVGFGNCTSDGGRTLADGKGLKIDPENGNKFRLDVSGTHIRIWFDDQPLVDLHDEKMTEPVGGQSLDHGGIGFSWGFECMGWIRNLSVKRLSP